MATTPNYGWTTPDDTALVKDGASAIRTLGSSVDTTTKNLNPETTLGDISFRSSTSNVNTRLGIGSTGQVLTVAGGVPTWATSGSFPAFVAYRSGNQTVTSNTATKLALNAETFDTDNCFDSTTNYRFTPTTAGKYTVGLNMYISGAGYCMIYKNGAEIYRVQYINANESGGSSVLVEMNGTTDYLEFFGFTAGVTFYSGSAFNFAWANWERA